MAAGGGGGASRRLRPARRERWRVSATTLDRDIWFGDPVSAACSVVANIMNARMQSERDLLCLHAAAVEVSGGLVVMPCRYRAGKSLLTAAFAATGHRVFNDDVVLLDPENGDAVAPGIAVRVRLPLPAGLDAATRDFLENCPGPRGTHYRYLGPANGVVAQLGERARIRGFVLLDRRDSGPAELTRIAPGTLLRQLIWQNFARCGSAERILETLASLAEGSECLQLRYSDLAQARSLLLSHFSGAAVDQRAGSPRCRRARRRSPCAGPGSGPAASRRAP
jgi:hypothetical protein